jgi:hypothetical protein
MGYNIFLLNNPFDMDLGVDSLKTTDYITSLRNEDDKKGRIFNSETFANVIKENTFSQNKIVETQKDSVKNPIAVEVKSDSTDHKKTTATPADSIKTKERKIFSGQYVSDKKEKKDSTKSDYSKYVFRNSDDNRKATAQELPGATNYLVKSLTKTEIF